MNSKELTKNMIANIVSFALNTAISFFLSSYIVESLGSEAYGFVKLSNDFVNYASLITLALNSMAARFIMISLNKDENEAIKYYNSVIISNIVLSCFLLIASGIVVLFCDKWLNIPSYLISDVKINFILVFINFIINLLFTTTGQVYYLTNKLYISSFKAMESKIIQTLIIIALFIRGSAKIWYLSFAALIASIYIIFANIYYRRKLLPSLKFNFKMFEWSKVKNLLASGVWNSITKLSQLFSSGLDLLVANLFVGSNEMGILSVAKTIPNLIVGLLCSIANIFNPNLTQLYAQEKKEELKNAVKTSMKIMCVFTSIPNAILVSLGLQFYKLWVPSQPAGMLQVLSILTVTNSIVTGVLQPIYSIFTITNRVKENSKVMISYGFLSILVTLLVLKFTNLGVYAIAGVSLFGSLVVALFYHLPKGAFYIGLPKNSFVPEIITSVISFITLTAVGYGISFVIPADTSWIMWFLAACIIGIIGLALNMMIVLKKNEREILFAKINSILRRKND